MQDKANRKTLLDQWKQTRPEAGVYRIVNQRNGRILLGASTNLASVRNKLEFARSTNMPGALDHRLKKDVQEFGLDAFGFEVIEVLEVKPETSAEELRRDLAALEALWREQQDPALLY